MRRLALGFAASLSLAAATLGPLGAAGVTAAWAAEVVPVTIDKMRVVRLKSDAHTVIVARPEIVNVVLESPRLMFVYGLQPGETSLLVLDNDEKEIFAADMVVTAKTARQVNVHRGTTESTLSCAPNCMRVATPGAAQGGAGGGAAPAAPGAAAGAASAAAAQAGGGLAPPPPATPAPPTPIQIVPSPGGSGSGAAR